MSRVSGTSSFSNNNNNNNNNNNTSQSNRPNFRIQSSRDDLVHNRYRLNEPQGVFPLDNFPSSELAPQASHQQSQFSIQQHHSSSSASLGGQNGSSHKYPDFQPWEHTHQEDNLAVNHLQKGYFETPHVANELLSARNIMHQLLRSQSLVEALSSNLLEAVDVRSSNNKIGPSTYKPPPRVTLTDQKRESWLRDLANSEVPLRKLARTIPHGVRNKSLLDQCVSKKIPINRAIWFVRCVGTNELRGLKRKGGTNIEFNWIQEWTLQVVEYIEKLSLEYLKHETANKENTDAVIAMKLWKAKLTYIMRFSANLYMEQLIDKESFKNWISRFFKNCRNFELPLALTIIKLFWGDILKTDYLIKELTEALLIRYHSINSNSHVLDSKDLNVTDSRLNDQIKSKLLNSFKHLIIDSFNQSIDNFILPNTWTQLKPVIKSIIKLDDNYEVSKSFDHISYRNESLMINYSLDSKEQENNLVQVLDKTKLTYDFKLITELIFTESWKENLKTLMHWTITKFRYGIERVYFTTELFKSLKQLQKLIPQRDIEQETLNIIFQFKDYLNMINIDLLFLLLNELAQAKVFKVSIYVRKLISSGLTYLIDNNDEKQLHASILKNLKTGITSQSSLVLKNLDPTCDESFKSKNEKNWEFAKTLVENSVQLGNLDNNSMVFLKSLPVGVRLKLSDHILKSANISTPNLPILSKIFDILGDYKGYYSFVLRVLENNAVSIDDLESISEFIISFSRLTSLFSSFDRITELFISNYNRMLMKYIDLTKFWDLMLEVVTDEKLKIDIRQIINNNKTLHIDHDLIRQLLAEIPADIEHDDFLTSSNFHGNFQVLIRLIFNSSTGDFQTKKSVLTLLKILKRQNSAEFNKTLFIYIKKTYSSANDIFRQEPILDLIVSELVPLNLIVDTFVNLHANSYTTIVKDLLFRDFAELENFDYLKFHHLRLQYLKDNQSIVLTLLKSSLFDTELAKNENIQSDSTEILDNFLPDHKNNNYRHEFLKIFLQNLIYNQDLVIKSFKIDNKECRSKFLSVLNDALFSESITSSKSVIMTDDLSNLVKFIQNINDLNLPVFQLLFKLKMDVVKSNSQFIEFFSSLTENISGDESSIGSLFELVDDDMKKSFIHYLESLFLTSKTFPQISIGETNISSTLVSDNLVKLSKTLKKVDLPDELVFALDNSLELLLKIVNKSDFTPELYDSLGLFLRIIIIHKAFIIDIIVERNSIKETFLNNLVNLLTSKFISQSLPLKNLLYDLLLSIKSSVNEMNISNKTNIVKLPVSLLNLPAISESSTLSHKKQYSSNIHDESIINDLYLYNKASRVYSELNVKAFDLVEDSNPVENLNDTAINLQLFETSIERKNPN